MHAWLAAAAAGVALMVVMWVLSLRLRDASIVDRVWGLAFVVAAAAAALVAGWTLPGILALALTSLWGLRLSWHIHTRNRGHPEDPRYAAWRQQHGARWPLRSLFQVFLLQGLLMWFVAAPVLYLVTNAPDEIRPLAALGVAVWIAGILFETIADAQLKRFKADPANKGRVMDGGLWRYSRHPNYFGEAVTWWGAWLVALTYGGWWTLYGAAIITFLLLRVSGVTMLEKTLRDAKPGYREYIERTSAFVPKPPRKA